MTRPRLRPAPVGDGAKSAYAFAESRVESRPFHEHECGVVNAVFVSSVFARWLMISPTRSIAVSHRTSPQASSARRRRQHHVVDGDFPFSFRRRRDCRVGLLLKARDPWHTKACGLSSAAASLWSSATAGDWFCGRRRPALLRASPSARESELTMQAGRRTATSALGESDRWLETRTTASRPRTWPSRPIAKVQTHSPFTYAKAIYDAVGFPEADRAEGCCLLPCVLPPRGFVGDLTGFSFAMNASHDRSNCRA